VRRQLLELALAGLLLGVAGCGGGEPAPPQELSADEEKEFAREQKEASRGEEPDRE
jgi:hypothetical protein